MTTTKQKKLCNIDDAVLASNLTELSRKAGYLNLKDFLNQNWNLTMKEAREQLRNQIKAEEKAVITQDDNNWK